MAQIRDKARVYVVCYEPKNADSAWTDSPLRKQAAAIPGVRVVPDIEGIEAARFGAETSGHTFLFDERGRLIFNGGITGSRGHSGDNLGESTIVALINHHASWYGSTSVFGCSLVTHQQSNPVCLR